MPGKTAGLTLPTSLTSRRNFDRLFAAQKLAAAKGYRESGTRLGSIIALAYEGKASSVLAGSNGVANRYWTIDNNVDAQNTPGVLVNGRPINRDEWLEG